MARNILILGCAALLAIGLSFGTFAGSTPDTDGDGVPDGFDNCVTTDNGPVQNIANCDGQEDGDVDGYGNACDYDTDQDGATGLNDLGQMLDNVSLLTTNSTFDNDCDGGAGLPDLGLMLDNSSLLTIPGPGLPCASLVPGACSN